MALENSSKFALAGVAAAASLGWFYVTEISAQGRSLQTPPVEITLKSDFDVPAADAQTKAITSAVLAFLDSLSPEQREAAVFDFDDNTQRSNWSNFPDGPVVRQGVMRGDMTDAQLDALNTLLKTVMSEAAIGMSSTSWWPRTALATGSVVRILGMNTTMRRSLGRPLWMRLGCSSLVGTIWRSTSPSSGQT